MKEPLVERLRSEVMWWSGGHERLLNQAIDEIVRLQAELDQVKRTWIEPKPVTRQSKSQGSTQRWPFMALHDHEHQAVTGISIPETPVQPEPLTMGEQLIAVIVGIWAEHPDYSIRQTLDELNRRFPAPQPEPSNESRALLEADAWMKFATACERIGQKLSLSEREVLALRDAIDQLTAVLMREPQRKPLTRGEIQIILTEHFDDDTLCGDDITLVRAIEAAHDIKETK